MCIVIDTNCFSCVFTPSNADHAAFKPVLTWIVERDGKIVYGGSKYKRELRTRRGIWRLFGQFMRAGKIVEVDDEKVNAWQAKVETKIDPEKHNDPHLVAIIAVSKCRVVCTQDKRSYALLKERSLYPKGVQRPAIYSSEKNADLLTPKYIADICRPSRPLAGAGQNELASAIAAAN